MTPPTFSTTCEAWNFSRVESTAPTQYDNAHSLHALASGQSVLSYFVVEQYREGTTPSFTPSPHVILHRDNVASLSHIHFFPRSALYSDDDLFESRGFLHHLYQECGADGVHDTLFPMISMLDSTNFPVKDVIKKQYVPAAMDERDLGHLINRVATLWARGKNFGFHFHQSIKGLLDHESSGTSFSNILCELENAAKESLQECDKICRQNSIDYHSDAYDY